MASENMTNAVLDVAGNVLDKGDTVTTISGGLTAKVCAIQIDSDCAFVQLRPIHQPFGKGVWHAADRVLRLSTAKRPDDEKVRGGLFKTTKRPRAGEGSEGEAQSVSRPARTPRTVRLGMTEASDKPVSGRRRGGARRVTPTRSPRKSR